MIFLDFIWLFIFMVLIDSRPMFKSIDEDYVYGERLLDNSIHSPVYGYNYARKLTTQRNNKHKIESQEIDLSGFDKFITHDLHPTSKKHNFHSYNSHKNLSEILMELTTEVENLKKMYKFDDSSMYRDQVTESLKQPSEDNTFLDSTAEIETVLNEIKQRALKMMIHHIPSSGNIINTAVTEIMYDMGAIMHSPKMTTGYMVFKKSITDNRNSLYNRRIRSIYHKAATIAHNLECNLQNKFVKSYEVIKNKVSANLGEELKHTENAIKEALNKLSGGKSSCKPKHSTLFKSIKTVKTTAPTNKKSSVHHSTKRKYFSRKTTLNPSHTIPKVTDDFSMLSVYEKILMNAHDENMRLLKTNTSKDHEMIKYNNLKRSVQELYEDLPDVGEEYDEENNITSKNDFGLNEPSKNGTSIADDEISFNTLSNKLSYNDYVNGFKYYLNFQKDQGNENFSNLVRYQAHRHHNVDDVGKYILEKLPQLPSTRQRRFFFEQDTLEDQDISTKSDDSWFKKHFYFFIDKDPPKKYHTFQTVSLKEDQKTTTPLSSKNLKGNKTRHKIKRAAGKLLIKRNAYKTKLNTIGPTTTLFGKNSKKNAYFDVSLVHRPTAIVKLQNKGKKRKFKNIFKKMTFHKKHPKKEMARDKENRMKRSNPFKILKDIVLRNRYPDTNNKVRKLFDYDVVTTSSNYNFVNHNNQLSKIEALLGQVPNITSKLESHDYDQYYYLPNDLSIIHNKGLYTTKERTLFISNELPLLPDLPLEPTPQNTFTYNGLDKTNYFDDIINIRVKAASDQETKSTFNSEERKKIDPLLENLLGSITAENFPSTENIQNNYVNHDTEREVEAMSDIYKTNIKKIQPNKYSYKLILYNDNKKENELRNMDPRYGNQQVLSKRAKSRNIFTRRKVPEKTVPHNKTDTKGSHKISSKLQKPQPANNVKKQKKPKILPTTKMQKQQKAHPDHFFTTPLPMSDNEFNKFLEDNNIDVQSVTAPLPNYIPFSTHVMHIVSKLKPYKNNIPNIGKKNNRKHGTKQNNYNLYIQRQRKKRDKIWKKNKSAKLSGKPVLEPEITFTPKNKISVKNYSDVKRSIKQFQSFTAHDVAALEIIVDLKKCSDLNENENQVATSERTINAVVVGEKPKITNAIQVHIALPDFYSETIKRSPESLQVKKVFSAIMASPIDIVYQLHTFEKTTVPSTTIEENKLSPGLYLLVENSNMSDPTAQLILKPMKMDAKSLNLELTTNESVSEPLTTTPYTNDDKVNSFVGSKQKRSINWDSIKRLFGHDRVCRCRCKANQTMCKACAASDAVISELIFEFDNLAKYMKDHCTEIQTFFWMNPTGGKKLRESVSRINKSLNDYYKRVKGKCNGRTCKMFSTGIDRRSIIHEFTEYNDNGTIPFLMNLLNVANDLENVNALGLLYDEEFEKHGQLLQNTINNCLSRVLAKRSDVEKVYSLDKININLICDPSTERGTYEKTVLHSLKNKAKLSNNIDSNTFLNNDVITLKGEKRKRLKDFVRHRFRPNLSKESFQDMSSNNIISNVNKKNNSINFRQRRKTKPVVNVLLLKNDPSNRPNRNIIHDTIRSLTTVKQYNFSDVDSLVHSMGKLFKLLGNPDIKACTSSHKNNKSSAATKHKLTTNNTKNVTRNKSTTNVLHTRKQNNKPSNVSKAISTTEKNEIINTVMGVTKHFLNKLKYKTHATEYLERHIRNVTMDTIYREPTDLNSHTISSVTDRDNPTIIILDENSKEVGESKKDQINDDDLRSLLYSVLNYNSKVLNDEWVRAANSEANAGIQVGNGGLSISKKSVNNTKKGFVNKLADKFLWSRINDKKKERFQGNRISTPFRKIDSSKDKTTDTSKFISLPTFTPKSTAKIGGRNITVCDISSTVGHILKAQKTMTKPQFETYMNNINCYKYNIVPEKFLLKFNRRKKHCKKEELSSNYERWRRDSKMDLYEDDEVELVESVGPEDKHIYELHDNKQLFERFMRGDDGLYRQAPRRMKRQSDSAINVLTNIPPLKPLTDEVFAMTGDSIVLDCYPSGCKQEGKSNFWIASHNHIILANLTRLHLKNIRKQDSGVYVCYNNDNMIVRRVKVRVMDVPKFNVVFATVYETSTSCTYNLHIKQAMEQVIESFEFVSYFYIFIQILMQDLRAIQKIGELMSQIICGNFCSIRIDEPVCMRDRKDEAYLLRTLTVIFPQYPTINCSIECQRNFRSSMSVLYAKNAPILASIAVTIMYYGGSLPEEEKTWTPSMQEHKAFVSHTLRTSDSNGHNEYHSLVDSDPGTIHIVVACPAGFFLVSSQKICGLCPSDTYSIEGGNSCVRCPDGTTSEPGSAFCHLSLDRLARSIWTDNPCVSLKAICVMAMIIIILYCLYRHFTNSEKNSKKSNQKRAKSRSPKGSSDCGTQRIWNKSRPPLPPLDF